MPHLFDDKPRNHKGPSRRAETTYSFLDRSSLPEFERIRAMLERWIGRLPKAHQRRAVANMSHRGRGSAKEESQFKSTFFELFLHEFLAGTGGKVQVEPEFDGLTPDFAISDSSAAIGQFNFVVEASDIDLERGTKLERDWNERSAIDALNEIDCPNFFLIVEARGKLESTPPKRRLKSTFENLIEKANYEELLLKTIGPDFDINELPTETYTFGNWTVIGRLCPVTPETLEISGGFVGVFSGQADSLDDIGKTRDRLYEKSNRYRNVDNLIIALRCDESNHRMQEVLFGRQQFNFFVHNDPAEAKDLPSPYYSQKLDGFWFNSSGPQNHHVIGVVVFYSVHPWSIDKSRAIFFSNPYVDEPMPEWTKLVTHAEYNNGEISIVEGVPVCNFLGDYEVLGNPFG